MRVSTDTVSVPDVPNPIAPSYFFLSVSVSRKKKDMQDLLTNTSLRRTGLLHLEENWFLESRILNSLPDPNQVCKKANE